MKHLFYFLLLILLVSCDEKNKENHFVLSALINNSAWEANSKISQVYFDGFEGSIWGLRLMGLTMSPDSLRNVSVGIPLKAAPYQDSLTHYDAYIIDKHTGSVQTNYSSISGTINVTSLEFITINKYSTTGSFSFVAVNDSLNSDTLYVTDGIFDVSVDK